MNKCIKCGKEATIRISPDLDIEGIHVCKACEMDVKIALFITFDDPDYFEYLVNEVWNKDKGDKP